MKKTFKTISVSLACALVCIAAAGCGGKDGLPVFPDKEVTTAPHSKAEFSDKVLGAWVGSAIGLGSGYEYVTTANNPGVTIDATVVPDTIAYVAMADKYWEPNGQVCSGSIGVNVLRVGPVSDARVSKNKVISDDDMHVDVLSQFIFRDYGPDVGAEDIAAAWDFYGVNDVGGGETVTASIRNNGYVPPYTGQSAFGNIGYWVTESWIENEMLGLVFPHMYGTLEAYSELFCGTQGDALSLYLGKLCAMMQCLALEYDDATVVMEKAFSRMNHYNEIYEIYEFVKACYEGGMTWRETCVKVVERAVNCKLIGIHDRAGFSINANAGMIFLSLFYSTHDGKTDFEEAIKIVSLCGLDGDCTAATVGGILGAMYGYEKIPKKYTDFVGAETPYYNYNNLNGDEVGAYWGAFAYCGKNFPNKLTFRQIADLNVANAEAQIISRGGSVEGDTYHIPVQEIVPVDQVTVVNASFETGATNGWNVSDSQKAQLSAVSSNAHLGEYGAMAEVFGDAQIYQNVVLKQGHRYRAQIWVNGSNDREFSFFAAGKKTVSRSVVNPLTTAGRHMKVELYFTADRADYRLGLAFEGIGPDESAMLFFDDFSLEDITDKTDGSRSQIYEAEKCYLSPDSTVVKEKAASGGKAVNLISGGGLRTDFTGVKGYQTFRFYYKNDDELLEQASLRISLDGKQIATIPLVSTGKTGNFNDALFADVNLSAGEGTHTLKAELISFYDIKIDKIEILAGHTTF